MAVELIVEGADEANREGEEGDGEPGVELAGRAEERFIFDCLPLKGSRLGGFAVIRAAAKFEDEDSVATGRSRDAVWLPVPEERVHSDSCGRHGGFKEDLVV